MGTSGMGMGWLPPHFRLLQERCGGVSPSILNSRLKELREADIVARTVDGYVLTERGKELRSFIVPLAKWSARWSQEVYGYERREWAKGWIGNSLVSIGNFPVGAMVSTPAPMITGRRRPSEHRDTTDGFASRSLSALCVLFVLCLPILSTFYTCA